MRSRLKAAGTAILVALVLLAGCAAPARLPAQPEPSPWRGRLALRIESGQPDAPAQSFAAGFELSGSPQTGELALLTPLGSQVAALAWTPRSAVMRTPGQVRHFESLDALMQQAVGAEIPVAALFAWLEGDSMTVAGWSADLSQHVHGRITARRIWPAPLTELRLILEP